MTHTTESLGTAPSPRAIFAERLREYASAHPDLSAGEVAEVVGRRLLIEDRGLLEAFFIAEGRTILSWDLRSNWVHTRRGIYKVVDIAKNGEPEYTQLPEPKMQTVYEQMLQWREFDPTTGQAKLLLSFTKPMLLASAKFDTDKALHHGQKVVWKCTLADGLPDDTTTVKEFYDPDQVLEVVSKAKATLVADISSGRTRMKVKSPAIPKLVGPLS